MKNVFLFALFCVWVNLGFAQEIEELKEARVGFSPLTSDVVKDGNSYAFSVKEAYAGEFEEDPMAFMEAYFDIHNFISSVEDENYDAYQVNLKSKKGFLRADFDGNGNLGRTSERFVNTLVPPGIREQIYKKYQGWDMVKNVRIVKGRNGVVNKHLYKIVLRKDNDRKVLKINGFSTDRSEVAAF